MKLIALSIYHCYACLRASHTPPATTKAYHGLAPTTTRFGAALDALGTQGFCEDPPPKPYGVR